VTPITMKVMLLASKLTVLWTSLKNMTQVTFEFQLCERERNMPWKAQENYIHAEDWNWRDSWKSSLQPALQYPLYLNLQLQVQHLPCMKNLLSNPEFDVQIILTILYVSCNFPTLQCMDSMWKWGILMINLILTG
jgi:hypothetical protein